MIFNLFILITSLNLVQAQYKEHIENVLNGIEIDNAKKIVSEISYENQNNPEVIFLMALIEEDGEKSIEYYIDLYKKFPHYEYADYSIMKIGEFYYAAGLYTQSSNWLKKMVLYYPRSQYLDGAISLFLNSLIIIGNKDTAIFYARVFDRQFPKLNINDKVALIVDEIDSAEDKNTINMNQSIMNQVSDVLDQVKDIIKEPSEVLNDDRLIINSFKLQFGAFSSLENAEKKVNTLSQLGYKAKVEKFPNKNLNYVRLSGFENRLEAEKIRKYIMKEYGIESIIISPK